ncbi:histidine--tRNA ligase [Candidatus Woesearchaeota archaeon]|nr:histidine--tRNA ligase [Candidatus Woesearchaeota archaeon]
MELDTAKGVRDFPPEQKIERNKIIQKLINIFTLYGFSPLETPIIERLDVLTAKYAGGEEITKEIFKLKDQGDRDLCLRYDLTVPLARFIGMNPTIKLPFKRYQIGDVFRDGPIKLGRFRQFIQCDADIVGSKSMLADAQCISLGEDVFNALNIAVNIEVNNRKILDGILEYAGIPEEKRLTTILTIDKLKKILPEGIEKELAEKGLQQEMIKKIISAIKIEGTNNQKIDALKKIIKTPAGIEGIAEIEQLLSYCKKRNIIFAQYLARGLAYYTSTVYEIFAKKSTVTSSLAAGGRYDKMIGGFLQNKQEYPAIGISFGIEPITEVWKEQNTKEKSQKTVTQVYVIPIINKEAKTESKNNKGDNTINECIDLCKKLRENGISTDMDINGKGITKNLDYANQYNIPFVIILGKEELRQKKVKLKDMNSGKEELININDAIKRLVSKILSK